VPDVREAVEELKKRDSRELWSAKLPDVGAVLAIDHGTKKTGFAFTDAGRIVVRPLEVFHAPGDGQELLAHIGMLVEEYAADTLVVGYPLHLSGKKGARAEDVDRFLERLGERLPEVVLIKRDETLTTKEAEARLVEAGHTGQDRRSRRDSWSAWVLLEDWLGAGEPAG